VIFFLSREEFYAWLDQHHRTAPEVLVGFYKRGSGTPSLTWPESVDAALCFGWIDGVRKRVDESRYTIRFTPRRPGGIWSATNIRRVPELAALGLLRPEGQSAFEARLEKRSKIYSYERTEPAEFSADQQTAFQANSEAWAFFTAQAPWYRRTLTHWVISAKREETRAKRLAFLIENCANGIRLR